MKAYGKAFWFGFGGLSGWGLAAALVLLPLTGCDSQPEFTQSAATEFFVQDFNPDYLDILWVVDDRSPMYKAKDHLVAEARKFFERLDGSTGQYRMGIVSADNVYSRGELKPEGAPAILTKSYGTVTQRSQGFANILSQIINLHTGYEANGFDAALAAIAGPFPLVENVPLVLVFISDGDDHSPVPNGMDAVEYYAQRFLALKGGKKDLVRVYSINLMPLNGQPKTAQNRCTTIDQAERDVRPDFQDRYFRLAEKLGGEKADLCGSFASLIQLSGLRLKELPNRFTLKRRPRPDSISITITRNGEPVEIPPWTYEVATNEIVFSQTPPAGTTIGVYYDPL